MIVFAIKKAINLLISLFAVATLTFFIMHALPGDPFSQEQTMPEEVLKALHRHYGLDKPLATQYVHYLQNILIFDLGPSMKYPGRSVNEIIQEGFPVSFLLGLVSLLLSTFGGLLLGSIAALKHLQWQDRLCLFLGILGISIPSFLLASFLQYVFAMKLDLLPVARWGTISHMILPAVTLAVFPLVFIARLVRANMVEVLQQDYIVTARSKGINNFQLIRRHVIRNSILPLLGYMGPLTAAVFTGSFIVEKIFGIPGLGQWLVVSIGNRDYPVIMGLTIFYSSVLMMSVFLFDCLSRWVDPRSN